MSQFTKVLKNRDFFLLWVGQIISQIGDRLGQMALIAFVYFRTQGAASTLEFAKILSFTIIPVFLIGPLAGVYVDRWDRRRTLYVCDFLRTVLVLAIPLYLFYSKNLIPMYLIIFVVFCIGRFFVPAKMSILPEIVKSEDLLIANSLVNTTGMIAAILGFGVSGVVIEWLGTKSGLGAKIGFYLDALSFFVSAALIFFITKEAAKEMSFRKVSREIVEVIRKSVAQEIKEGILYFMRNKDIRFTAGIIFILWAALGAIYVVLIVFVQKTFHSATKDLGLLIMYLGVGLFFGSVIYGHFGQKISRYKIIFVSLILSGIMLLVFALVVHRYPNFFLAAALSFLLGLIVAPIMIASNTIVHNASANEMMGKIFSALEIVMHLGFLLFMFISGFLAKKIPEFLILIIVGCIFSILGLLNLIYHRKIPWLD